MARGTSPSSKNTMEAPKGTWTILLLYAGVIVALWVYSYMSLLLRR
ncbi:MAG: hypothetical protein H0Z37_01425 [Firmicutes bacterium]|nr:hypothetical protein [Bacillota bacterium]